MHPVWGTGLVDLPMVEGFGKLAAALLDPVGRLPGRAAAGTESPASGRAASVESPAADAWVLDHVDWLLRDPRGRTVQVTSSEMRLLNAMLLEPGATVSRGALLAALGYREDESGNRSLDLLVSRLRRKIEVTMGSKASIRRCTTAATCFRPRCWKSAVRTRCSTGRGRNDRLSGPSRTRKRDLRFHSSSATSGRRMQPAFASWAAQKRQIALHS